MKNKKKKKNEDGRWGYRNPNPTPTGRFHQPIPPKSIGESHEHSYMRGRRRAKEHRQTIFVDVGRQVTPKRTFPWCRSYWLEDLEPIYYFQGRRIYFAGVDPVGANFLCQFSA